MKVFLRLFLGLLFASITLLAFAFFFWYRPKFKPVPRVKYSVEKSPGELSRLQAKAILLKQYALTHRFNGSVCFLVDMNVASGKSRFFVFDLDKDSVILAGLVAHGSCDAGFQTDPRFSNTPNSGCSSLGKYKIGNHYQGNFGLAYKLYGLDSLNSHAYERNIVLHSYDCVPEQETDPIPICNSRGCPMVSPGFLNQLALIIDQSKKPILLWIFD
jgi:hypothetical protein